MKLLAHSPRALLGAAAVVLLGTGAARPAGAQAADLVLTNAKVVTVDDARPEAQAAVAAGDSATIALGADGSLAQWDGGAGPRRLLAR